MSTSTASTSYAKLTINVYSFYIFYIFRTDRIAADKKALWAVVIFLGNMIAMPVFFFIYVWPETWPRQPAPPTPKPTVGEST